MEHGRLVMALLTVIAVVNWAGVAAQSDCSNVLISLAPCLNYITGNSSTPSSGCCTQLATVVRSQPQCLCQVLNGGGGSSLGININQTLALALPRACNVQTPSISSCNAASPTDSPAGAPGSPNEVPSGPGSRTVPSTDDNSSGSSIQLSKPLIFFILLASTYVSASKLY